MYSPIEIPSQHFNRIQIWALTGPFHYALLFEPFFGGFASVFRIVILLKGPLLVQFQLLDRWPYVIFKHSLIWCWIHNWINKCKLSSPWGSNPKHNMSTTMLHSWYEVLLKSCLWSVPNMSAVTVAKQLYLWFVCPEHITSISLIFFPYNGMIYFK